MAKRYHHSLVGDELYSGHDKRRQQEREAAGMISEDRGAIANMPQQVIMKQYPAQNYASYSDLDDTARGIDVQTSSDSGHEKRGKYPEKY